MTGVNINKIRHYAPGFNSRTTRLDPDAAALIFKAGNAVISKSERLIADVSVKAAMPTAGDSDGKKRGPESSQSSKYVNYHGVVFDPNGTKTEGSYFKHYVTESERIEALRAEEPRPNWGWINLSDSGNRLPSPKNAVAKVTRFPVNPKTGEPMKNFGFEPEIKGLGPTIGEKNPGGKLAARAARAMGLVIDAMGRFRCPPGFFTANRFTNERGEGCFGISPGQIQSIANALTGVMSAPGDKAFLTEALLTIGITALEIRKEYESNGVAGLASLASRAGFKPELVGDKAGDASYMSTVVSKIRERLGAAEGAPERMEKVRNRKNKIIDDLKAKYKITETDEYLALTQIFKAMSTGDDAFFSDGQFEDLFVGGSPEAHEQWVVKETITAHIAAIARKTGISDPYEVAEAYYEAKTKTGEITPLTRFIDASIEREKKYRIGAFKQLLVNASENPDSLLDPKGQPIKIIVNPRGFTAEHTKPDREGKIPSYSFYTLNGMAGTDYVYIGSGPAIQGYRDSPPPGYYDLYEATGGDIDDQWRAITEEMDGDEKARRFVQTYATDLTAENGNGWEDFGAQAASHEMTHIKQYHAIIEYFRATRPGENFDEKTNGELWIFVEEFLRDAKPEQLRQVFGIDLDEIIEKRIDALAGAYSQFNQQEALKQLAAGDPKGFQRAKNVALLETLAELNANRSVGLIGEDPEVDEFLDSYMFNREKPDGFPSGLIIPGTESVHDGPLIVPGAPPIPNDGELIVPGKIPQVPVDAPQPAKPSRPQKVYTPLDKNPEVLPSGAGRINQPRPSGGTTPSGRRTPRGPVDYFEKERSGKIPREISDGRFTNEDIDEHLYGKDGKGPSLRQKFRSARNVRIRPESRWRDTQKQKEQNEVLDNMGISFEELERIALKAKNGEPITPEEKRQIVDAVAYIRSKGAEYKRKSEEAIEKYRNYRPVPIDPRDQWDDVDVNTANRERIQEEIELYENLFQFTNRSLAPAIHDVLTIAENGPYPNRLGQVPDRLMPLRSSRNASIGSEGREQESVLSNLEVESLTRVSVDPPRSYLMGEKDSKRDLELDIEGSVDISASLGRYGIEPTIDVSVDADIEIVFPAMNALEKLGIKDDIVVEIEIDIDGSIDTDIGSTYEIPSLHTAEIVDHDDNLPGLASRTRIDSATGRTAAGLVGRFIGSSRGRRLIEKAGVDPEQADLVQLISEVAIGFSIGGPAGAIVPLARRGSRDAGEKALQVMVERGWIEQSLADKIIKYGLDRIASEGLPDELIKAAEVTKDALLNDDTKRKALEMGSALQERSAELAESARERASQLANTARGQASEIAGRINDRRNRRKDEDSVDPFSLDPFGNPIPTSPSDVFEESSIRGLASSSAPPSQQDSRKELVDYVQKFKPSKVETENPIEAGQFEGGAIVTTTSYEIGGEKVIFGNPSDFTKEEIDAKIIPLNPFEISGLSKDSEEGQKAAIDWFFSRVAITEDARDVLGSNDVEALLYAASQGDGDAQKQLEELSKRGKKLTEARKRETETSYTDEQKAEIASQFDAGRLPTSNDLVAVRQISFPPKFDDEGNLLLENASDYDVAVTYEADGSESKERYKPSRKSVHFTINTPVAAHPKWKPGEDDYILVIDFAKMLEANPDSLDNLLAEDTFLTGKPGQPLKVPKGFFTYERIQGRNRSEIVADGMRTLGKGEEFPFVIGEDGEGSGTKPHMADALDIISEEELGVQRGRLHMSHPLYIEGQIDGFTKGSSKRMPLFPSDVLTASGISLNSVLALAEKLNWSDAKLSAAAESVV